MDDKIPMSSACDASVIRGGSLGETVGGDKVCGNGDTVNVSWSLSV